MSTMLDVASNRCVRLIAVWLILLSLVAHRGWQAWTNFEDDGRPDGNFGHTSIDFAGQWMMGRLLVLGHGHELYSRERHREVAEREFPIADEAPGKHLHDAEVLIGCYPGDPNDPVGGPLYPPVHAFVMAPVGAISSAHSAYRAQQGLLFLSLLIAAWGVRSLSRGRWWWPAAAALLFACPGMRAGLDLGQNPPLTLAILIWGWAFLVRGRPSLCGVLWGLLAFKPVWAMSFLGALILLREWRAVRAMIGTGAALIAVTIPFVGLQSWFDWLHVGQLASSTYNIDRNWIFLSRDLFGVPRRMLLDFEHGRAINDRPLVAIIGWSMWLGVAATTLMLAWRGRAMPKYHGAYPAFILFAAWLCTYRFMYYDAAVATLGVVVLLADPSPFFRRAWWPVKSWAVAWVALMFIVENVTVPLNIGITGNLGNVKRTITATDGTTAIHHPTFYLASNDEYPWDTLCVLLAWVWCGWHVYRSCRLMRTGEDNVRTA